MKRGPKPKGDRPLTGAERQSRYRALHKDGAPRIQYKKPLGPRSRPARWMAAAAELRDIQEEYQDWLDSLPQNLMESQTAELLQRICAIDLTDILDVDFPRGFGRD